MSSDVRAGSSPAFSTQRDKSSFLDLSLFLFFRFTLLKWAILCKMRLNAVLVQNILSKPIYCIKKYISGSQPANNLNFHWIT